ncbi:NAD(P)H:quinone oxidoreductase, type IV [Dichotomocladium elegans]|nr:NAD(P)H:quinone oxidoreductase, type IV [Dichotomocladium elegans]
MAPKVFIIIHTIYHHIYKLSLEIKKGLEASGVEVELYQVPETLSDEILTKMHALPKPDIPVITVDKLPLADGFVFGFGTRFGTMPAQVKAFLDATGQLWAKGALAGKFATTFFSTASQHGGQESTALTTVTYFAHHGIIYVPFGFAHPHLFDNSEVVGGSPYGAGTVTNGDGSRQPSEKELEVAKTQGENFGKVVATYAKGKSL